MSASSVCHRCLLIFPSPGKALFLGSCFWQLPFLCKFAQEINEVMAMTSIPTLHYTKYDPARLGKGTKLAVALAALFFLLVSCRPVHYPQSLLVADSLCAAHPQRALEWLDSLRPRMEQERKGVRMYYDLLCIKAHRIKPISPTRRTA